MKYIKVTRKNVQETVKSLEKTICENGFGLQYIHNVTEKLKQKELILGRECQILDICQPHIAKEILDIDPSVSAILPCSISVYEYKGETNICVIKPSSIFPLLNKQLDEVISKAEKTIFKIIDEAV